MVASDTAPPVNVERSTGRPAQLAQPVAGSARIEAIDIVRGFALFGVLMLNMLDFAGPTVSFDPWTVSTGWLDKAVELGIRVFGEAAFYSTFSFLFGLGFALQFERALARGERFRRRFAVRVTVLLGFGLIHAYLIWSGDILVQYSITGFFLLLFAKVRPTVALRWAVGFALFTIALMSALVVVGAFEGDPGTPAAIAEEIDYIRSADFGTLAADRSGDIVGDLIFSLMGVPWFLSLFLVGLWAVRSGKLANWRNERTFLIAVLKVALPIAVVAKGLLAFFIVAGETDLAATWGIILSTFIGGPAFGAVYVCLVLLALQRAGDGRSVLRHLAPVGRMALTNYLMQSVVAVLFFYGWGLGNYGRFGVATAFLFTLGLFAFQMVVSRLWLARFPYGPMEWVWRTLTYRARLTGDRAAVRA
ncbi:MAG: DUF418 domain-containing protein [Actinomycetota bacterium]